MAVERQRVLELWNAYLRACTPDGVTFQPGQMRDLRHTFYAGAIAVYSLLVGTGDKQHSPEQEAADMKMINEIGRELSKFNKDLKDGKA